MRATYIYIISHGHSGSTLLELLLGRHSRLTAMGELEKLSLQFARDGTTTYPGLCSCGRRPMDCPVWGHVAKEVHRQFGVDLSRHPFGFRVSDIGLEEDHGPRALGDWLLRRYTRLSRYLQYHRTPVLRHGALLCSCPRRWARQRFFVADTVRRITEAGGVIDSSKDWLSMRDLYEAQRDRMTILYISRNVYGNVWSYAKTGKRTVSEAARAWVQVNRRIRFMLSDIPQSNWQHVRYEDLCARPEPTLRSILTFLGHEYETGLMSPSSVEYHTIGGNKIRFGGVNGIQEDLSWRQHLSPENIRQVARIADPIAGALGYGLVGAPQLGRSTERVDT